jgi:hypothetical protein
MSAQIVPLREAGSKRNVTSSPKGRRKNTAYRVHEHLTEAYGPEAQSARSPRLADRPLDLPTRPARFGSVRPPLG